MKDSEDNNANTKDKMIEKIVIAFCIITCFGFFFKIVFF